MATAHALRTNVPGWGADLDPGNRPGVPREKNDESVAEVQIAQEYQRIPRQPPRVEILVSSEHRQLPPIFGTSCPPHGFSGVLRRLAFKYSEGQKAHWLILLLADRVDVIESAFFNLIRGQSHNPLAELGWRGEFRRRGFLSRFGHHRADTKRWSQQTLLLLTGIGVGSLIVRSRRRAR